MNQGSKTFSFGKLNSTSVISIDAEGNRTETWSIPDQSLTSDPVKVELVGGSNTAVMKAKLYDAPSGYSVSIQFYTNIACTESDEYGKPLTLSTSYQYFVDDEDEEITFTIDNDVNTYLYCKATVHVQARTAGAAPDEPLEFTAVFCAEAEIPA